MEFGITFKGDLTPERTVALAQQAEASGFAYGWTFDSHVLWKECYVMLTLLATQTRRMHWGPLVTNPAVRDETVTASALAALNLVSGGRAECGIGRGDSSRRVLGHKPTTIERLMTASANIRALAQGGTVDVDGVPTRLTWANPAYPLRMWIAGYGPQMLRACGRHADGIVLQFADPHLIQWCLGFVREGAAEAGRDDREIRIMSCAPVWVSDDLDYARAQVRWFPAMVGNHVADLVTRYRESELPPELTAYIRGRHGYDYHHHADKDADHLDFITDEVIDRFNILGPAAAHVAKLKQLEALGVHQFNIYLMSGDEERTLEAYARDVLPQVMTREA
jgi:probable F420-dependent oxidoreductase